MSETVTSPQTADNPVAALCACGHRVDGHDAIASRYCNATLAGVLPRGCICVSAPEPAARP
jgi:hypothetical protein